MLCFRFVGLIGRERERERDIQSQSSCNERMMRGQHSTVQFSSIQFSTVQASTVQDGNDGCNPLSCFLSAEIPSDFRGFRPLSRKTKPRARTHTKRAHMTTTATTATPHQRQDAALHKSSLGGVCARSARFENCEPRSNAKHMNGYDNQSYLTVTTWISVRLGCGCGGW